VAIMLIRRETPADQAAVHAVHGEAFRREAGVRDGTVVGHVCCSRARLGEDTAASARRWRTPWSARRTLSATAPDPQWGRYFQARTLAAYEPTQAGAFEYAPAFSRI
jgi:putative acetyltransferase